MSPLSRTLAACDVVRKRRKGLWTELNPEGLNNGENVTCGSWKG